jgi:hypothetical protein
VSLKKVILLDAPYGAIVRYQGEWGVVSHDSNRSRWRVIDFWAGGRQHVPDIAEVELLVEKGRAL